MSMFSRVKPEYPVSEESALASVMKILDYYEYDIDAQPEGAVRTNAEGSLKTLLLAFREGTMQLKDGAGCVVIQTLKKPPTGNADPTLEYGEFTGKIKWEMDKIGADKTYQRMHTLLGALCGLPAEAFKSFSAVDLAVAEALGFFFLTK